MAVPCFQAVLDPLVAPLLSVGNALELRLLGLCIYIDVLEYGMAQGVASAVLPVAAEFVKVEDEDARQTAAYGIGVLAQFGGETLDPAGISTLLPDLLALIVHENSVADNAISSVLMDTTACNTTRYTTYGEEYISQANTEARNRIVATLLNLSTCKKNRMILSSHKGLIASILHCIKYDDGESRQGCCTVLLYLAKTAETRPMLVQFEGLVDVLSGVIDVPRCNNSSNGGELKNGISRRYQNRFLKEMNQEEEEEEGGLLVDTIEATPCYGR